MIYRELAKFYDLHALVLAELSNGETKEIYTAVDIQGLYSDWWENPTGQIGCGEVHYIECEPFVGEWNATYPDEWTDINGKESDDTAVKVVKILEVKKVEWKLEELLEKRIKNEE